MKAKFKSKVYPIEVKIVNETESYINFIMNGEVVIMTRQIFYFLFDETV